MEAVLAGVRMSKMGRPAGKSGRAGPTKPARMYLPEWENLYWVSEVLNVGMADVLRPIVKADLQAQYDMHRADIDRLKAVRAEEERIKSDAAGRQTDADPPAPPEPTPKRRRAGGS